MINVICASFTYYHVFDLICCRNLDGRKSHNVIDLSTYLCSQWQTIL